MVIVVVWTDKAGEDLDQIISYWSSISTNSVRLQVQRLVYYIVSEQRIDILTIHNSARPLDMEGFS